MVQNAGCRQTKDAALDFLAGVPLFAFPAEEGAHGIHGELKMAMAGVRHEHDPRRDFGDGIDLQRVPLRVAGRW